MKYSIRVEWKDGDERDVVVVKAADAAKACAAAVAMAEDGRLRTVAASWDPEPAYVTSVSSARGALKVPPSFTEGAVHVGDDWPKVSATSNAMKRMREASAKLAGVDAAATAEIDAIRSRLARPRIDPAPASDGPEREFSVVVAWFEKSNVLDLDIDAHSASEACRLAIAKADDESGTLDDLPAISDAFVLAIVEGVERRADEIVSASMDVPAPWSEGWRLHHNHLRLVELYETALPDALAAFRAAAGSREEILEYVAASEEDFQAAAAPSTAPAAPTIR